MEGFCDSCIKIKKVKRLDLGGGAGIFLCEECFNKEMEYRAYMNKKYKDKFVIKKWEDLKEGI